jgi:TolA-binding protein
MFEFSLELFLIVFLIAGLYWMYEENSSICMENAILKRANTKLEAYKKDTKVVLESMYTDLKSLQDRLKTTRAPQPQLPQLQTQVQQTEESNPNETDTVESKESEAQTGDVPEGQATTEEATTEEATTDAPPPAPMLIPLGSIQRSITYSLGSFRPPPPPSFRRQLNIVENDT